MKKNINITTFYDDAARFESAEAFCRFCRVNDMDGVEVLPFVNYLENGKMPEVYPKELINGIHLSFNSSFVDFWKGDREKLLDVYGSMEVIEQVYGGLTRECLIEKYEKELELAKENEVSYVVFHVADVDSQEMLTYQFKHTDEEVIRCACEIINTILDGKDYDFWFLCENLWWAGFRFTDPELTKMMLDGIHYEKKGIMLDTGHLLHTNNDLIDEDEGVDYILEMYKKHGELGEFVKGIHLQQCMSGAYVKEMLAQHLELPDDYNEEQNMAMPIVYAIDGHNPFTTRRIKEVVDTINPEFLTFEFISGSLEEYEKKLKTQYYAIYGRNPIGEIN